MASVYSGLGQMGASNFLENVVELRRFWTSKAFADQLEKSPAFEGINSMEFDTTLV